MTVRLLGLALLVLSLAACDSGEDTLAENTYTVTISGDGTSGVQNRSGAYAGSFDSYDGFGTDPAFAILLGTDPIVSTDDLPNAVVAFVRLGGRPTPGTYVLATEVAERPPDNQFVGLYLDPSVMGDDGDFEGFYVSQSGTLTITESTDRHVAGSYTMGVRLLDPFTGEVISGPALDVSGEFNALITDDFRDDGAIFERRRSLPISLPTWQ